MKLTEVLKSLDTFGLRLPTVEREEMVPDKRRVDELPNGV